MGKRTNMAPIRVVRIALVLMALSVLALTACGSSSPAFDPEDLEIRVLKFHSEENFNSFDIELENKGPSEVGYLKLYISYPIKQGNGIKVNPYKVEAVSNKQEVVRLKQGEKVSLHVSTPTKEVFGDSGLIDLQHPSYELDGYVLEQDREVPFQIGGGLVY